ncbi:hypothetical protein LVD17_01660 [Fulvivirga ulvae]|uniref:hypothetical protein n=1 Tax=Fulvivirga ulvae TaxID=2904245 RepID=UPI001F45D117|nr:hypothetical protein [Fulvivirga ulvae]UII32545.1 hypothetical protein LVD17_01660 [Fulvivirga ulvae]
MRAAVVVLLLLFVFYGFLKYRQYDSYHGIIHENADLIIKINSDQLIRKIAFNTLSNPSYYFSPSQQDSLNADEDDDDGRGFTLPANLFAYTLKGDLKTFYTTLKVNDSSALRSYIQKNLEINRFTTSEKYSYAASDDGKIHIAFDHQRIVLAYTFTGKDVQATLEDILFQTKTINADSKIIAILKDADGDAVIMQDQNITNVDFDNGKVTLSGILNLAPEIELPSTSSLTKPDTSASIHIGLAGKVPDQYLKNYEINHITIPLDSLAKDYEGYLDLRIAGTATQYDTIITYDYNDDFEKVEVKTLNESQVPGVKVLVRGKAIPMMEVLKKNQVVLNNKLNRTVFPLLDMNIKTKGTSELVLTNIDDQFEADLAGSSDFFMLYANFQRMASENPLSVKLEYLKNLRTLNINASQAGEAVNIKGQLLLKNKDINALMQLIELI